MALIAWRKLQAGLSGKGDVKSAASVVQHISNTTITQVQDTQYASSLHPGIVTLALQAAVSAGIDNELAVTPDALAGSVYGEQVIGVLVESGENSLGTGDAKNGNYFRIPVKCNGWNIVRVAAQVWTAGSTGTSSVQLRNVTDGVDILSVKLTIDSGEKDSSTAATAAIINTANDDVATGDQFTWDVDSVHTTTAPKGLYCEATLRAP